MRNAPAGAALLGSSLEVVDPSLDRGASAAEVGKRATASLKSKLLCCMIDMLLLVDRDITARGPAADGLQPTSPLGAQADGLETL